jgi:hypothetical protein
MSQKLISKMLSGKMKHDCKLDDLRTGFEKRGRIQEWAYLSSLVPHRRQARWFTLTGPVHMFSQCSGFKSLEIFDEK